MEAGLVYKAEDCVYSSAKDYASKKDFQMILKYLKHLIFKVTTRKDSCGSRGIYKVIISFSISFILFNCQNNKTTEKENIIINNCDDSLLKSYDSLFIIMSNEFNPTDINFDQSIKSNQDLDKFISSVKQNDICFNKSKELDTFVIMLILKQYKFHLENYHQGYDLFSMNKGNANYVIDKYLHIIDENKNKLEMLNSGYIIEFLNSKKTMKLNESQKKLIDEINKISIKQKEEKKIT